MTVLEMEKLQDQCLTEWHAMSEVERQAWATQSGAKHMAAMTAQPADAVLQETLPFESWVGCGYQTHSISIESIAGDVSSMCGGPNGSALRMTILPCV